MELSVARLKRTLPAQYFKRTVLRRGGRMLPRLTVVVPFHDTAGRLEACVESLLRQTHPNLRVVLVDDGSTDGSSRVARDLARGSRRISLVTQEHHGVGAARNAGAARARGRHLAFCDSDDVVLPDGYERLAGMLQDSGSDLAVGSVTLQRRGRHREPPWAQRSNADRMIGATLEQHPAIIANLVPGARVFRRSFWVRHGLSFPVEGDQSDVVTMVRSLLLADRIDVAPAVVYQWHLREDGSSLYQQSLLHKDRMASRMASINKAGDLVVEAAGESVQNRYFAEILNTTVPDLVRAAVTRQDGYWEALSAELARLLALLSEETFRSVPVEDRVIAWLCAHDHREAAEDFLVYAFDNKRGFPHRIIDDRPHLMLSFIDAIGEASDVLTGVADSELGLRTRLLATRWTAPHLLEIEGSAFIRYLDDDYARSSVVVALRDPADGREWRLPTEPVPGANVNGWSVRAHEDHDGSAFRCTIDTTDLPAPGRGRLELEVGIELTIGAHVRSGPFHARAWHENAGLLEPSTVRRTTVAPHWRPFGGLSLRIRAAKRGEPGQQPEEHPVRVHDFSAGGHRLTLAGESDLGPAEPLEISLIGPRGSTGWVAAEHQGAGFTVSLDSFEDEWGLGSTGLPADRYAVSARRRDGGVVDVAPSRSLWRSLPRSDSDSGLLFLPFVTLDGLLTFRVIPEEWPTSRPPYYRRRLRDVVYPEARTQPLLDVALFETFAGKAAGDNPGALCRELAGREEDLELVFSVMDRSIEVPAGARSVIRFSREYFELLGRARYLIVNASLPYFFRKREGQLYFQTWHGSPLKQIAHDRPHLDFDNWHHRRQLLIARDGWDYLLSQSEFCTRALRSAFRYDGPVMELGYPRNDLMLSAAADAVRRRTREHFGIGEDQLLILYAPTWRDNQRVERVFDKVLYLDPHQLVHELDDAVVFVRGHYNSMQAAEEIDPERRVVDVTRYPDIADLYVAADAMVTDYSSVFFDFVLTDKPMVFLAPDLKEYRDDNRGFYLDYSVVPGPVCLTTTEVAAALRGPDEHGPRRAEFREEFAPKDDGTAAARVLDAILVKHPYRATIPTR